MIEVESMSEIGLENELEVEVLLNILEATTREYMKAFGLKNDNIELNCEMIKKYQAFDRISAYYMDSKDECISFVMFNFDWKRYELICKSDDPEIAMRRKSISAMTPKQILEDACTIIKKRVEKIKSERDYQYIRMVYTYSDKVFNNKKLLEKVRKEANLVPFDKESLKFSKKIDNYKTLIESSLTEKTLSIDFIS